MRSHLCFSAYLFHSFLPLQTSFPTCSGLYLLKSSLALALYYILIWVFTRHDWVKHLIFTLKSQLRGTDYSNLELSSLAQKGLYLSVKMDSMSIPMGRGRRNRSVLTGGLLCVYKCQNNGWPILMPVSHLI